MAMYKDVSSLELVGFTEPENSTFTDGVDFILEKLDAIPEEDVKPVVHAHWIVTKTLFGEGTPPTEYKCSACECPLGCNYFDYCPHCGATMDEIVKTNKTNKTLDEIRRELRIKMGRLKNG